MLNHPSALISINFGIAHGMRRQLIARDFLTYVLLVSELLHVSQSNAMKVLHADVRSFTANSSSPAWTPYLSVVLTHKFKQYHSYCINIWNRSQAPKVRSKRPKLQLLEMESKERKIFSSRPERDFMYDGSLSAVEYRWQNNRYPRRLQFKDSYRYEIIFNPFPSGEQVNKYGHELYNIGTYPAPEEITFILTLIPYLNLFS